MDPLDRERIINHLSAMTDDEYRQLAAEARPETMTSKAAQLLELRASMDRAAATTTWGQLGQAPPTPEPPAGPPPAVATF